MCELNKWGTTRIDPCMRPIISVLNQYTSLKILGCCCGHDKYDMTIVVEGELMGNRYELFSGADVPRIKRFYRRDEEGYYYIPEVL